MNCPDCGRRDCIEIEIRLGGDEDVKFFSCRQCGTRWWEREGSSIALHEVLTRAQKPKQRR